MAEWLERWTTDPRVAGSNLTFDTKNLDFEYVFFRSHKKSKSMPVL